jgi:branched-chain amino acid transport system substrate-binding protein
MKRFNFVHPLFLIAILILVAALVLVAYQSVAAVDQESKDDTGPIVIGVSLPVTGRRAEPGVAAKEGYAVWAAMVNEAGGLLGRKVELIVLDNGSEVGTIKADYERLINEYEVDLVVGSQSSQLVIPSSEVAAKYDYAYVEPAGGAEEVFNRGLTNIFFAQPAPAARQADAFALYILGLPAEERPQTFAIVTGDDPFALTVMARLKGLLADGGVEQVLELNYPLETDDFSDIASQVAVADPDLIVGGTTFPDSVGQVKAYMEVGYQPRFAFFTSGPATPVGYREALGPATEGIFSAVSWFPEGKDYQNAEFVARYLEMFGGSMGDVPEDAANAFTVGQIMQQAIEKIQSIDNAALIEELHRGSYQTVVGPLSFDETGAPQGSFMLLQWQGENFVIVGPKDRAEVDPLPPPKPAW